MAEKRPLYVRFGYRADDGTMVDGLRIVRPGDKDYEKNLRWAQRDEELRGIPIPWADVSASLNLDDTVENADWLRRIRRNVSDAGSPPSEIPTTDLKTVGRKTSQPMEESDDDVR